MKKVFVIIIVLLLIQTSHAQDVKTQWVDSVFNKMRLHDKIGQLLMIPVRGDASEEEIDEWAGIVKSYDPGGLYVKGGGPRGWINTLNRLQKTSRIPLIVGTDAEWGPGQTFDSLMTFQKPIALGAVQNDSLIRALGKEIARELRQLGIHINFAPNADINLSNENIAQYLGSNKKRVSATSIALVRGMQENGVIACAKHSSNIKGSPLVLRHDSTIFYKLNRLDTLDFYPYAQLIKNGVGGMLTSHLHFSTQEKRKAVPASVSAMFVNEVLQTQLGFRGLMLTDIPFLQSISKKTRAGETEQLAFEIGNDFLINPQNPGQAIKKIQKLVKKNPTMMARLDASVRKILSAKYDVGLREKEIISDDNIVSRVNSEQALALKFALSEHSITILKNFNSVLPVKKLNDVRFASLSIGIEKENQFTETLNKFVPLEKFEIRTASDTTGLSEKLSKYDFIIIGVHPLASGFETTLTKWIQGLGGNGSLILCSFANPKAASSFESADAVIATYTDEAPAYSVAAQVIFGSRKGSGSLPLTISEQYTEGTANPVSQINRLGYGIPEEVGMDAKVLGMIGSIAREAIDSGATPGCSIVVARKGKVVYERSFGWQTYENKKPVDANTIYDLASITKVTATLQAIMFLSERGEIDINKKASVYLPELRQSNKKDFTLKDILTHQAGLWPYLPFWLQTMSDKLLMKEYYSDTMSAEYPFPVAKNLFAVKSMKDSLWNWIINARVRDKTPHVPFDYRYSDMGFYILQHLAEKKLNQPIEDFLEQNFYAPIGAYTTGYLPLERFPADRIAPTEVDSSFRKSTLIGYVHDQGAAMHGGVAGHAGLFSSANDLAKMGQMWLQRGSYGGLQFLKPETIKRFTHQQYETSRRGVGWDKPTVSDWNGPTTLYASPETFGHTGFTGTCVWVDPEFDLVFVFLSNRVYPDMNNGRLLSGNIRPRIQEVIYRSIFEYCKYQN